MRTEGSRVSTTQSKAGLSLSPLTPDPWSLIPAPCFARNEIRHKGYLGMARSLAKNTLSAAAFTARKLLRQTGREEFLRCRSLEEYFRFAVREFLPEQYREEILPFLQLAQVQSPCTVCEIGTRYGGTHFLLSQALSSVSLAIGIDLYVRSIARLRHYSRPELQSAFIHGNSSAPPTINQVERILNGRRIDLLFIDGDHRYAGVRDDFLAYRHLMREGGLIAFHDIVPYQGKDADGGRFNPFIEVPQFWSKIKPFYPAHEFIRTPEQNYYGIGAIQYSSAVQLPDEL